MQYRVLGLNITNRVLKPILRERLYDLFGRYMAVLIRLILPEISRSESVSNFRTDYVLYVNFTTLFSALEPGMVVQMCG